MSRFIVPCKCNPKETVLKTCSICFGKLFQHVFSPDIPIDDNGWKGHKHWEIEKQKGFKKRLSTRGNR